MNIQSILNENYNVDKDITAKWAVNLKLWKSWYVGKVKKFHSYKMYNGIKHISRERMSLQMAKKCCEDWADTLFNERVKIEIEDEKNNEILFDKLESLNFWEFMNNSIEQSGSTGTGAIVLSLDELEIDIYENTIDINNSNIVMNYVEAENIYPISWSNGRITECAFTVKKLYKGQMYVFLSVHTLEDDGNYIIENKVYRDEKGNLIEIDSDEFDITPLYNTKQKIPWFAILKPAGINNIDTNLPFGLPYFAQAIDILKRIDMTFDSLQNEIELGRKRIFVRQGMTSVDTSTGEQIQTFDDNDIAVYSLPKGFNSDDLIQSENSQLRIGDLTQDLENSLAMFGDKVGFGVQYYQIDPTGQVREIGILTQNSKMIRRKKKHEIVLESALYDIIQVIMFTMGIDIKDSGLKITFDNDIIDDENERKKIALTEISSGVLAKSEYREMFMGEPDDIAIKKIAEIVKESEIDYGIINNEPGTD